MTGRLIPTGRGTDPSSRATLDGGEVASYWDWDAHVGSSHHPKRVESRIISLLIENISSNFKPRKPYLASIPAARYMENLVAEREVDVYSSRVECSEE